MAIRKPWEMSLNTAVWTGEILATLTDEQMEAIELLASYQAAQCAWSATRSDDPALKGMAQAFDAIGPAIAEARTTGLASARDRGGLRVKDEDETAASPAIPAEDAPATKEEILDALEEHFAVASAKAIPIPVPPPASPTLTAPPRPPVVAPRRKLK